MQNFVWDADRLQQGFMPVGGIMCRDAVPQLVSTSY
jgi:hypothetical protein